MDAMQKRLSLDDIQIPGLPDTTAQIIAALEDDFCSVQKLEEVILRDPSLTAEVLRIVNAPLYQTGKSVSSVADTIMFIGMGNLVTLVSIASLTHQCMSSSIEKEIVSHLLAVSSTATLLAEQADNVRIRREIAVVAGLLHDIGIIVLMEKLPLEYGDIRKRAFAEQRPLTTVEQEMLGFTHCHVGAILAERWHFPAVYKFALEHHHDETIPETLNDREALCLLIRLADKLVSEAGIGDETPSETDVNMICNKLGIDLKSLEPIKKQIAGTAKA